MLEVRFFATDVTRSPQASGTGRLREGSFNPCSSMINMLKLLRLLAHTSRWQEFMTLLREAQRHASSRFLCIGACFPDRTRLTDMCGKEDLDDRLSFCVPVEIPSVALLSLWAGDPLLLPVDLELFDIHCSRSASLPTGIDIDWSHQIGSVSLSMIQM